MNPAGLRQPDRRSCGASVAVVARARADATYAAGLGGEGEAGWRRQVLTAHRRLVRARLRGRLQPPWPRTLGTPPWALARELGAVTGRRHHVRVVRWSPPTTPRAGALYVGSRWLPRHVLLVLDDDPATCWDPASGRVLPVDHPGRRWRTRWFAVTP